MIRYRPAQLDDLERILDWAAAEGWNPGLDDAAAFLAGDPGGFFLAENDGAPVAAISVVNHTPQFAFLGLYICQPAWRGKGIGYALWQRALEHAGNRTVGLDGVPDQQANYKRSGFVLAGETARYSGSVPPVEQFANARQVEMSDISKIVTLEGVASGTAKPAYISAWCSDTLWRKTCVIESDGHLAGFATVRKCRSGAKVGPLVAQDIEDAHTLLTWCASQFGRDVTIDVPAASAPLARLCNDWGMTVGFKTARMYRGAATQPGSNIYAVASLELG